MKRCSLTGILKDAAKESRSGRIAAAVEKFIQDGKNVALPFAICDVDYDFIVADGAKLFRAFVGDDGEVRLEASPDRPADAAKGDE